METLTAAEIRKRFLDFFREKGHEIVRSGPLIPEDDATLLFTNAGMVQFKRLFLGEESSFKRAASCQKCLRVSGKHNDLENVGRTARHHTFFEMLGNFSFGNYFKREAIAWAWEFVTQRLNLPPEKLWVTVYRDDDEAFNLWKEIAGLPEERIVRMDEKDNFWTMGDTGPCGPCSEIYIDQGEDMACGPDCGIGKCDCDRFLEIWNLVFTQYDQPGDGSRVLLAAPNIDTGMGLERIAAVCQGKKSNFDCDLFQQLINYAADLANVTYSASAPDTNDIDTALRVIADHARAAAFLIAEGVLPSNEKRGYVLRRLVRRALRFATLLGVHEPFLHKVAARVTEVMGDAYPELAENSRFIERAVLEEERRFAKTLDNGLKLLEEDLQRLESSQSRIIPGEVCFRLSDTYGFPLDIVEDIAAKRGFGIDHAGFERLKSEQQARAREDSKKSGLLGQGGTDELKTVCKKLLDEGLSSVFTGYESLEAESPIVALLDSTGQPASELGEGASGYIMTAQTPFYPVSGGQQADTGILRTDTAQVKIMGALRPDPHIILLEAVVERGEVWPGQNAVSRVDPDLRLATARNHTSTHLLQSALRKVLGKHVKQAGSLVTDQRLRFDFSHFSALTAEELAAVEREVNRMILDDLPVQAAQMGKDEALASGATALFGEKYGDVVRVLTIGREGCDPESVELCGGTHLRSTGQAGSFYIVSESAVGAGARRLEAVTGWNAYNAAITSRGEVRALAQILKTSPNQVQEKTLQLQEEVKKLRKKPESGQGSADYDRLVEKAAQINGITLLEADLGSMSAKEMLPLMDRLRSRFDQNAVVCLAGVDNGKVSLALYVSKNLHSRFTAPKLIQLVAGPCGGKGGGRPDLAQAGGSNPQGIGEGFTSLEQFIKEQAK